MALKKISKADLRSRYPLFMQAGLIGSLLILIGLTNAPLHQGELEEFVMPEQELVQMEEVLQTKQVEKPPPPPKPPVPVEVPDDEILENDELDLDAWGEASPEVERPEVGHYPVSDDDDLHRISSEEPNGAATRCRSEGTSVVVSASRVGAVGGCGKLTADGPTTHPLSLPP